MTNKIEARVFASANALVERLFEGDKTSVTLAAFEYSYQADMFAKVVSKETDGVIVVRGYGRNYAESVFANGKEVKGAHWAKDISWDDAAK